jgi:hypothetical protein
MRRHRCSTTTVDTSHQEAAWRQPASFGATSVAKLKTPSDSLKEKELPAPDSGPGCPSVSASAAVLASRSVSASEALAPEHLSASSLLGMRVGLGDKREVRRRAQPRALPRNRVYIRTPVPTYDPKVRWCHRPTLCPPPSWLQPDLASTSPAPSPS